MRSPEHRHQPQLYTLEEVANMAKEAALASGGHVPALIAEGNGRTIVGQLANLPDTHEGRLQAMFAAGTALAESREVAVLEQVFLIFEGWMSHRAADQEEITVPPSQDPGCKEVLIVSASRAQKASLVVFEMVRDEEEKLVALERLKFVEDADLRVTAPLLHAFLEGFRLEMRSKLN